MQNNKANIGGAIRIIGTDIFFNNNVINNNIANKYGKNYVSNPSKLLLLYN